MISFNEISKHLTSIDEDSSRWMFEDENGQITNESKDQIWAISPEISKKLWDYETQVRIFEDYPKLTTFFKDVEIFNTNGKNDAEIKKWLHRRGIQYDTKVYAIQQPTLGYLLTWKMIIKHYEVLYTSDATFWDNSLNWGLACHHDGLFVFGKNQIYDDTENQIRLSQLIQKSKNVDSNRV